MQSPVGLAVLSLLLASAAFAERLPAATRADWVEILRPPLRLLSQAEPSRNEEILRELDRFPSVLAAVAPSLRPPPEVPLTVLAFGHDRAFRPYKEDRGSHRKVSGRFQVRPEGAWLAFNAHPDEDTYDGVLRHELTHLALWLRYRSLPVWLHEGLAQYVAALLEEDHQIVAGRTLTAHLRLLRRRSFLSWNALFDADPGSPVYRDPETVALFYAQSWGLIHYLLQGTEGGDLDRFVQLVGEGRGEATALREAYGVELDTLERLLRGYVNRRFLPRSTLPFTPSPPGEPSRPSPLPRAQLLAELGGFLAHDPRADPELAKAHLEAALELEPDLAEVHLALERLRQRAAAPP